MKPHPAVIIRPAVFIRSGALRRLAAFAIDFSIFFLLIFAGAALADLAGFKRVIPSSPIALQELDTLSNETIILPDGATEQKLVHLQRVATFGLWEHSYLIEVHEITRGTAVETRSERYLVDPQTLLPTATVTSNGLGFILLPWIILLFEFSGTRRTPGRRILDLNLASMDGSTPTDRQFLTRSLVKAGPFFLIAVSVWRPDGWAYILGMIGAIVLTLSFLLALVWRQKSTLHDFAAKTAVIRSG